MASEGLTEYERKRLENIKRNDEQLSSLNVYSKLADLYASVKRNREPSTSYKLSPEKKVKSATPIVTRRSLRTQGKEPDSEVLKDDFSETPKQQTAIKAQDIYDKFFKEFRPIRMRDANTCYEPDEVLEGPRLHSSDIDEGCAKKRVGCRVKASIDLESMELSPENIARVVPGRILAVKFFPSADMRMVVAGNKSGDVGFWNANSEREDGDGIYLCRSHKHPVSGIVIRPFFTNKIITSCYGGVIHSLDLEKEMFDLAYSADHAIYSISHRLDDVHSLYVGEGQGMLRIWDERSGNSSLSWDLHENRINTIDFNPANMNMMATSSSDGTACIWDLRKVGESKPESLKLITRKKAVQSAYFSPSGSFLATTSFDDKIGVLSGVNYDEEFIIKPNNQTGKWLSSFKRGVWGWDDSYIFVGDMKRGVDVICTEQKRIVTTLESPHMSAIPCRLDPHPLKAGVLAGATSGGHVYIWST